jgi:KDO2-lipid IV(A) lauroyltransferase
MSVKLAQQGYMVNFLTRPMRDEGAGEYLHNLRENAGVKTIFSYPRKECVSNIIKALGNNEIVIMQMDQNFGSSGVWVKFFSKLAATPTGPVTVALRTEAAIIPAYIYRQTKGRHCIKIFPKQDLFVSADKDETILRNVAKLSRMIENWVKVSTYQWGWIHRRWKSQPPPQAKRSKFSVEEDLL